MKSKIAGVALATVMACCWASGASAGMLGPNYNLPSYFDSSASIFDVIYSGAPVEFRSAQVNLNHSASNKTDESIVDYMIQIGAQNGSPSYVVNLLTFKGTFTFESISSGFEATFAGSSTEIEGTDLYYDVRFSGINYSTYQYAYFKIEGVLNATFEETNGLAYMPVPPVPLPSSAPMFGAALLGLAGVGYFGRKRLTFSAST